MTISPISLVGHSRSSRFCKLLLDLVGDALKIAEGDGRFSHAFLSMLLMSLFFIERLAAAVALDDDERCRRSMTSYVVNRRWQARHSLRRRMDALRPPGGSR